MRCGACGAEVPADASPCPSCGQALGGTHDAREQVRRQRPLPGAWDWLPGVGLAFVIGLIVWVISLLRVVDLEFLVTVGVLTAFGGLVSYTTVTSGFAKTMLVISGALLLLMGLGLFILILLVLALPLAVGAVLGRGLRHVIRMRLRLILLIALTPLLIRTAGTIRGPEADDTATLLAWRPVRTDPAPHGVPERREGAATSAASTTA